MTTKQAKRLRTSDTIRCPRDGQTERVTFARAAAPGTVHVRTTRHDHAFAETSPIEVITLDRKIVQAVHTAVSELPDGTHRDDIADCVCGIVGFATFDANETAIIAMIADLTR